MGLSRNFAKSVTNNDNPNAFATKLRTKRLSYFLRVVDATFDQYGKVNIIDIGGTKPYWNILPEGLIEEKKIHITIINLPGENQPENSEHFTIVDGDACDLSRFEDKSFHISHSNSVLEHVGDWQKMKAYSNELKRVSERYYIQTPNYWFPVEPHCMTPLFHWLPTPIRISLVMKFNLGHWKKANTVDSAVETVESARLVNKKMFRELYDDAEVVTERLFFFAKSFTGIRNK